MLERANGEIFTEAKVSFSSADLDTTALHLRDLAQASVDVANNVVNQAIETAKLTGVTRESAIATLVKNGTLQAATVAEAQYAVSVQTVTQAFLSQMSFIQQMGFITGKTLGDMGISSVTWVLAATNVITVFGDMTKAMTWLDTVSKTFLSPKDYAQYNLDTANRGLSNLKATNPALSVITADSVNAALKGGNAGLSGFITQLATDTGAAATETKTYIDLLIQQISAQKALDSVTGSTVSALSDNASAIAALQDQLNLLTGATTQLKIDKAKVTADKTLSEAAKSATIALMEQIDATKNTATAAAAAKASADALAASWVKINDISNKNQTPEQKQNALGAELATALKDLIPSDILNTVSKSREAFATAISTLTNPTIIIALSNNSAAIGTWYDAVDAAATAAAAAKTTADALTASWKIINDVINKNQTPEQKQNALGAELATALKDLIPADTLNLIATSREAFGAYIKTLTAPDVLAALFANSAAIGDWYDGVEAATAKAKEDASKTTSIQIELLNATGKATEALTLTRQSELSALTATDQAIKLQVYAAQDAATAIASAMADLQSAVQLQKDSINTTLTGLNSISSAVKSFLNGLSVPGNDLSSRQQAKALIDAANISMDKGILPKNTDAISSAITTLAKPSEALFASFNDYKRDLLTTASSVSKLDISTTKQITNAEAQLKYLDGILATSKIQIDAVNGVSVAVISVGTAIAKLTGALDKASAVSASSAATAAATAANNTALSASTAATSIGPLASMPIQTNPNNTNKSLSETLGIKVKEIVDYVGFERGFTLAQIMQMVINGGSFSRQQIIDVYGTIPGFASGGDHTGGWRIVGENGPELENTGPSRIHSNANSKSLIDNSELIAEIKALREEVSLLRAEARATASHTNKTAKILERVMPDGDAISVRTAA